MKWLKILFSNLCDIFGVLKLHDLLLILINIWCVPTFVFVILQSFYKRWFPQLHNLQALEYKVTFTNRLLTNTPFPGLPDSTQVSTVDIFCLILTLELLSHIYLSYISHKVSFIKPCLIIQNNYFCYFFHSSLDICQIENIIFIIHISHSLPLPYGMHLSWERIIMLFLSGSISHHFCHLHYLKQPLQLSKELYNIYQDMMQYQMLIVFNLQLSLC